MGASATADRAYKHVDGLDAVKRSGYSQPAMAHVHVGLPILACALTVPSR